MRTYTYFMAFIALLFSSCEDVVEMNIKQGKEAFVVEGWITNKEEANYIKLFKTIPYFNNPEFPAIRSAVVTISDDAGNVEILKETEPGKYEIQSLKGVVGRTYKLSIQSKEGSYEAITTMQRLSWNMDSVTYEYKKKSVMVEKEGYYPAIYGQEQKNIGDFILLKIAKNGTWLKSFRDINLFSDEFVDGNYITAAEPGLKDPFKKDEKITYEMWSLTEDAYRFWNDIRTQLSNGGLFAVPSTNARSNIVKKDPASLDVVGYFGASEVKAFENVVK